MPIPSYKIWPAQSPIFASGGSSVIPTQDAPDGRILGILLRMKTDIVQGAGAVAITGSQLYRLFDLIRIRDYFRLTGRGATYLRWLMAGFEFQMPQDVLAAAATYSRNIDVWIPFADFFASSPLDTAMNTALIRDQPIEVNWGNVSALFGANTSLANTSVRALLFLDKPKPDEIPTEIEVNYQDWNQQSVLIPGGGAYTHLFAYSETTDSLTDTNFATWSIFIDGDVIKPVLQTGELMAEFDIMRAAGVTALATSSGTPGENLIDEPGVGAAAGQGLTTPMIPLLVPPGQAGGYNLSHCPMPQSMLRVDFTGAATSVRLLYRRARESDKNRVTELARKLRISDPAAREVTVSTAGFGRLTATAARVLPKRIKMTPEEIRARGGAA